MYRTLSRNGGKRNGGLSRPRLLAPLGLKSVPDLLMPVSLNGRTYLYEYRTSYRQVPNLRNRVLGLAPRMLLGLAPQGLRFGTLTSYLTRVLGLAH